MSEADFLTEQLCLCAGNHRSFVPSALPHPRHSLTAVHEEAAVIVPHRWRAYSALAFPKPLHIGRLFDCKSVRVSVAMINIPHFSNVLLHVEVGHAV